jgi:thioredoxin reductase
MPATSTPSLPVAVIGAGPIGLAAAAHLLDRGLTPLVLEAGRAAGRSLRSWGHVRVFSPWKYMVDGVARELLHAHGWSMPDEDVLPTGDEIARDYLEPLAALPALAPHIRWGHRVTAVSRLGFDKVKSTGRDDAPFELVALAADGAEVRVHARAVIDASGTYTTPNPMGAGGLPIKGEHDARGRIFHGIPDVLGRQRTRYAGRHTLVLGSGHSAFNALLDLARLKTEAPNTQITWALRRSEIGLLFGGGAKDALPARGSLGAKLRQLVDIGVIDIVTSFRAQRLTEGTGDGVLVHGGDQVIGPVDEIVVAAGFRPDLDMLRELRLALDPALEAPVRLAPLIDPNVHSCGTVYPHGYLELQHPERDFYIAGMKSYGRAPTFLMLTGYEQVRSIVSALAGDMEGARDVQLVLPETGVCSTDLAGGSACCSTANIEPALELAGAGAGGGCACG